MPVPHSGCHFFFNHYVSKLAVSHSAGWISHQLNKKCPQLLIIRCFLQRLQISEKKYVRQWEQSLHSNLTAHCAQSSPPPASLLASGFTETQNGHLVCCAQIHTVLGVSYILHNIVLQQHHVIKTHNRHKDIKKRPTQIFSKKKKKANFAQILKNR